MTRSTDQLLADIETFMEEHSVSATAFGEAAMNDRHLVRRLRNGGSVTLDTADLIRLYMATHKQRRATRKGNAGSGAVAA